MFSPVSVEQWAPGNYFVVVQILNGNQHNYTIRWDRTKYHYQKIDNIWSEEKPNEMHVLECKNDLEVCAFVFPFISFFIFFLITERILDYVNQNAYC